VESASYKIQPKALSTTATITLPKSKESNAVHSTTIPAAKSKDSSVLSKHSGKNFMDLPRELRDLIYYHALVPPDSSSSWKEKAPICLALRSRPEWNRLRREMANLGMAFPNTYPEISPRINIALFCTNRTLGAEAETVFYRHNAFTLHASWFWNSKAVIWRPLPAAALSKLRKLYVGHWGDLIWEPMWSMRVTPGHMDGAREEHMRAVSELPFERFAIVMGACYARIDFLAALPALREFTIKLYSLASPSVDYEGLERLVVERLYNKIKERPELGLPPVRLQARMHTISIKAQN
jgi:hypothetical protein